MRAILVLATALLWLPGCDDDGSSSDDNGTTELAIVGEYVEKFMDAVVTEHTITADSWSQTFAPAMEGDEPATVTYTLGDFDNDTGYVVGSITQEGNTTWSRFDWAEHEGATWYCTSVFGASSADEAKAGSADRSNLPMGCGMFMWSKLEPK